MQNKRVTQFADMYQAVGDVVRIPFIWRRTVLVNSAQETLMERRGRWFSLAEDIFWKGFTGETRFAADPLMIKASSGELVGSATGSTPTHVTVSGREFTFELVKRNWWSANLVLRDHQSDIIEGKYNSSEFRLLRAIGSLPAAVAIYWILFEREQNT